MVYELLAKWAKGNAGHRPNRRVQNELRARVLASILTGMPEGCAVVAAELPLPPHSHEKDIKRFPGFIVLDASILPPPPYPMEDEQND